MKKLSIQIKIGLLMMFAVILLSATSYLSYRNLSSIAASIQIDLNPELRIISIRDISHDLETADNSIRIYTVTGDTSDLRPYYSIINGIDKKVNQLQFECMSDTIMLTQIDTISNLIEENIVIWNELLYLIDRNNVVEFLKHLSDQISEVPDASEKRGILKRVFARNSKSILPGQELIDNIQKIEEQERINKKKLRLQEQQLASTSSRIKEKFFDLIARMENQATKIVMEKSIAANKLAEKTYLWLILFSVSGGLLSLLVLYIIIRYIRNAHALQIALEKSKNETENLARTKELFMANISHEIRTPVTAISGFTEQLLHETSDKNILQSLQIIKSSSDHLAIIIDDILDLTKLQNSKLELEKVHFSIARILKEVHIIFEQQAGERNIRLNYIIKSGTPPVLFGDPFRLKQILINLVGNSVKFTENGSVDFSVEGITNDSGVLDLIVDVIDTGIGIDEDKLKMIFEDFTQAEMSTTRKYGGTGLGLSIVKKLVELHGGHIECESKKTHGTRIICHLPYQTGLEDQIDMDVSLPLTIPEDFKDLKVLIVDDEEYNRLLFKKILKKWEIKYDEAASGIDAIEILRERRYDLVFMDIRMPGIDGIKATQLIRNELKISEKEMKLIFISAAPMSNDWIKYRKDGVNAFIQKPFTEKLLLMTILSVRKNFSQIIFENSEDEEKNKPSGNQKINLRNLHHIADGDNHFIKQMLVSFKETTHKALIEMQDAVSSGNWDLVANLAHKILPPCRHLGAMELYDLLKKIEGSFSNKTDPRVIEKLINQSLLEFEAISTLLNEYITNLT